MLALSGAAGFLASVLLLRAGIHAMWLRYPLAALVGYAAFVVVLRAWIALQRGRLEVDSQWFDVDFTPGERSVASEAPSLFPGGRGGGAGGGTSWGGGARSALPPRGSGPSFLRSDASRTGSSRPASRWLSFDLDDDLWWVALAIALLAGALVTLLYVVYIAPVLLAEVALDAALVSGVYRRLRPQDARHWAFGVVWRTWIPAIGLALCLSGAGYALQQAAPGARSMEAPCGT